MTDVKELVERLRRSVTESGGIDLRDPDLLRQAASALQSLVERNAAMEEAMAALRQIAQLDDTTSRAEDDIDALYRNERTLRDCVLAVRAFLAARSALPPEEQS